MLYPPAKVVRMLKIVLIFLPLFTFFFGTLFLAVQYGEPVRRSRGTRKIPFEETIEASGICHNLSLIQLPNDTYIAPEGFSRVNETVLKHCRWYLETLIRYYRPTREKVAPYQHNFVMNGSKICDKNTDVIVLVHSLHDYYEKREAIRLTWGHGIRTKNWPGGIYLDSNIKLAFVFGKHNVNDSKWHEVIEKENEFYGDIIQGDFIEHYHNMTLKSLLGLKWVKEYCPSAKFLVKSDDDMIINFPYLLKELRTLNMTRAIMGPYNEGSRVYRTGKWKIPKEEYPFAHYPPYESGSAYIINTDLIADLYKISEFIPHIFIDDVYITGIVGKAVGARHIKHDGFAFWTDKRPTACHLLRNWIVTGTKMKPNKLNDLWAEMQTTQVESCPEVMPTKKPGK